MWWKYSQQCFLKNDCKNIFKLFFHLFIYLFIFLFPVAIVEEKPTHTHSVQGATMCMWWGWGQKIPVINGVLECVLWQVALVHCSAVLMHLRKWTQLKSSHTGLRLCTNTQAHPETIIGPTQTYTARPHSSPYLCYLQQRLPPRTISPQHSPCCCSHRWHTVSKLLLQM